MVQPGRLDAAMHNIQQQIENLEEALEENVGAEWESHVTDALQRAKALERLGRVIDTHRKKGA